MPTLCPGFGPQSTGGASGNNFRFRTSSLRCRSDRAFGSFAPLCRSLRPHSSKIGSLVTGHDIRTRATVVQQKTGRPVQFEITAEVRASLLAWLQRRGGTVDDYAFPSRVGHADHLSTRQYARLVDEWVTAIGLRREDYGTHSLRRTKAAMIYKATGNLRAIQILLGHTKIENTVRYLGVDIEDALELAERTEI